jgi:TPR repeat protein
MIYYSDCFQKHLKSEAEGIMRKFVVLIGVFILFNLDTQISVAAEINDCDRLAASTYDNTRPNGVTGVSFSSLNAKLAIPACERVLKGEPKNMRFLFQLGRAYEKAERYSDAFEAYRKSADAGNTFGMNNLGGMYALGRGVPKDDEKAVVWYTKAAEQGNANAQENLGVMYKDGRGVSKDEKKAQEWLTKAAKQKQHELPPPMSNWNWLADLDSKENREAAARVTKAAEQGNADAQAQIGQMYANGIGVPKDYKKAVEWYTKAAEQGNANAQENLGVMYKNGRGVSKDDKKAQEWLAKAAEQRLQRRILGR